MTTAKTTKSAVASKATGATAPVSFESEVVEAFKKEFKGMPYTELSVIVRCGHPNAPTYQEIELPVVTKLLNNHREK